MEVKVFIQANWDKYDKKFDYAARSYLSTDAVLIEERTLQFESLTENELRTKTHKLLLEKKNKVLADAMVRANELEKEAQELLALEDHSND